MDSGVFRDLFPISLEYTPPMTVLGGAKIYFATGEETLWPASSDLASRLRRRTQHGLIFVTYGSSSTRPGTTRHGYSTTSTQFSRTLPDHASKVGRRSRVWRRKRRTSRRVCS